jgi:DNA-binding NarL/FixJ family response regulator
MSNVLPQWLLNPEQFELFANPLNQDECFCLTATGVSRVKNANQVIKDCITRDMENHPVKVQMLNKMGYIEHDKLLEKYASCLCGTFDLVSDTIMGHLNHTEYRDCTKRDTCIGADIVCNPLHVKNGTLKTRKVQVLKLIGAGLLNKEIAHELNISPETVKIHISQTLKLTGLDNKKDLIKLAYQKNLAS